MKLVLEQVRHQAQGGWLAFAAVAIAVWYASSVGATLLNMGSRNHGDPPG
jgi:hypothetical protein